VIEEPKINRNLALELLRVTEAGALAAAPLQGRGNRDAADRRAVEAIRESLSSVDMKGTVVIGEGEKDEAPMLFFGEEIGNGLEPEVDVAVDPIEGTSLTASGLPGAISVVALAERGTMFTTHVHYMLKLVVGRKARGVIDLEMPVEWNLRRIAKAEGLPVQELTVVVLERDRNKEVISQIRDVDLRLQAVADLLAEEQHRRFVLLALADDDGPFHVDRRERLPDGLHRPPVGGVLVAATLQRGGRERARLGDA